MSGIDILRAEILAHNQDFTAKDFIHIKHIHALLGHMLGYGEIEVIGSIPRERGGKAMKLYRIVDIGNRRPMKYNPVQLEYRTPEVMEPWASIWPDLFKVPDFAGFQQSARNNVCMTD